MISTSPGLSIAQGPSHGPSTNQSHRTSQRTQRSTAVLRPQLSLPTNLKRTMMSTALPRHHQKVLINTGHPKLQ